MSNELGTGDERNNENRRHVGKVAIDKGIRPVEISAKNDMPPGILSMTPLATVPTPLASPMSANIKNELGKPSPDKAQRVRDVVNRKR